MFDINKKIENVSDVENFFNYLIIDKKINFHPDDSLTDCTDENGNLLFTSEEAKKLDDRINECFDACEKENEDIYEISFDILSKNI